MVARTRYIWKTFGLILIYFIWAYVVEVVSLSVLTYSLFSGALPGHEESRPGKLQEISELFNSSLISMGAFTVISFIAFLFALHPLTQQARFKDLISFQRLKTSFLPGALRGVALACGLVFALVLGHFYSPAGFFIQLDEAWIALGLLALKSIALFGMVYAEEFLFRKRLLDNLLERFSVRIAIFFCALLYTLLKSQQFDLGWTQSLSIFLVSILLSIRSLQRGDFVSGAGQWFALLWVFHVFFGLPILGIQQRGLFSLSYVGPTLDVNWEVHFERLLSGGLAGPLSSGLLVIVLIFQIVFLSLGRLRRSQNFRLNAVLKPLR